MPEMEIATLFTAEAAVFTLTSLVAGMLSDRIGRKSIMIIGLLFSAVSLFAFFFVKEYWQILFLMALYGFGSSSVFVMSSTMVADILPEENKAMLFGAFDALIDLGMVVGPLLCFTFLAISRLPINHAFLLMAVPSIIALGIMSRIKETRTSSGASKECNNPIYREDKPQQRARGFLPEIAKCTSA